VSSGDVAYVVAHIAKLCGSREAATRWRTVFSSNRGRGKSLPETKLLSRLAFPMNARAARAVGRRSRPKDDDHGMDDRGPVPLRAGHPGDGAARHACPHGGHAIDAIHPPSPVGRPWTWPTLVMLQALRHVARDDRAWRRLPAGSPPHQSVRSRLMGWRRRARCWTGPWLSSSPAAASQPA
jgi:hypothetical protein